MNNKDRHLIQLRWSLLVQPATWVLSHGAIRKRMASTPWTWGERQKGSGAIKEKDLPRKASWGDHDSIVVLSGYHSIVILGAFWEHISLGYLGLSGSISTNHSQVGTVVGWSVVNAQQGDENPLGTGWSCCTNSKSYAGWIIVISAWYQTQIMDYVPAID